jgi:hypothetical protein
VRAALILLVGGAVVVGALWRRPPQPTGGQATPPARKMAPPRLAPASYVRDGDEAPRREPRPALATLPPDDLVGLARSTSDPWLEADVIETLAARKVLAGVPAIAERLQDVDRDVRRVAADALAELGDDRALPALPDALRTESDPRVRGVLAEAIAELRPR